MRELFLRTGNVIFAFSKPIIYLLLNNSRRSRVAIVCNDQILMVKSWLSDNKWGFPGGGIKRKESDLESVKREVYEETGINLGNKNIVKVSQYTDKYLIFRRFLIFYKTTFNQKPATEIVKKLEIVDIKWFKVKDIIKNPNLFEDQTIIFVQKLKIKS